MIDASAITTRLSAYVSDAMSRELPPEVMAKAKLHLIDTMAAMVSGSTLLAGQKIVPVVRKSGGVPLASVIATDILTTPAQAALANGMMAHANETDDSHAPSLTHPGCVIVPAALAAAEANGCSGTQLLRAIVLGYDISTRISMALGGGKFADTYHLSSHGWGGTFGAAAAASALAGLKADACRNALSYAVQNASGNRCWVRDIDHVQKAYIFGGMPARGGVMAAEFAAAGLTGVGDALEGTPGLFAAFPKSADATKAVEHLGERFEVMRTTIKKWCVGSPIQAALDCIENVVTEHEIAEPQIASITVSLPLQRSRVAQSDMPNVNLPHALALYLVDGGIGFASIHDHSRMSDPEVRRVASRISVEARPGAARGEQAHFLLRTTDGREFRMAPTHVRGQPGNPMTPKEVTQKANDLFAVGLGANRAEPLLEALMQIDDAADIRNQRKYWSVPTSGS